MVRVLVVEDSITQREILRQLFASDADFQVVGEAATGIEAVELAARLRPDVVLMDIHMPTMDGISATHEIMRRSPVPIVITSATLRKEDVNLAMKAFEAGAISVIEKPQGAVLLHLSKIAPQLRTELLAAASVKMNRRTSTVRRTDPVQERVRGHQTPRREVIGICTSTGGPAVLLEILSAVSKPIPLAVLLVQHISHGFVEGFARWLAESTGHAVRLASQGSTLEPGIWVAPPGRHLAIDEQKRIALPLPDPDDLHCPSANVLLGSLARYAGRSAIGILLTGMGDDGATGLLELKTAGGTTIVQDEKSSLIWGMPKAGRDLGAADFELDPSAIAQFMSKAFAGHSRLV